MSLLRIWTCSTCSAAGVVYSRLAAPCAINNVLHLCFLCFMCFRISGCSGLRPAFYDKCVNKTHDISSTWPGFLSVLNPWHGSFGVCRLAFLLLRTGFLVCLQYILRMKPGSLLFAGVPCSGHVWISQGSTGKSKNNPRGNMSKQCTRDANKIACRFSLAAILAAVRQVLWLVEQPGSSVLPYLPYITYLLRLDTVSSSFMMGRIQRLCPDALV